jgi:hypothetical protein
VKFNCTSKLPKVFELRNNTKIKYSRQKRRLLKGRDRKKKKEEHKQEQPKTRRRLRVPAEYNRKPDSNLQQKLNS